MTATLLGALCIGLSLGILGSGGSILTVPILVYLLGQDEKTAIAGSLAIVGIIAFVGAIPSALRKQVDWPSVLIFGLPGMAGTYAGAVLSSYLSGTLQLTIFAISMLVAAARMFRPVPVHGQDHVQRPGIMALQGVAVGVLTGIVGIGGGFLILPALVLLGGLTMHRAVGTSLAIISLNSASGLARHALAAGTVGLVLDWRLIAAFATIGAGGSLAGQKIGRHIPQQGLRRAFSAFLVVMAAYILWRSMPLPLTSLLTGNH
jgi:uncharacterized membrane protein YfcA